MNDSQTGPLRIYKSTTFPWAPARKVWNQYAYNVVNVNDDLTIPQYQLNLAVAFPGPDGIVGTDDDIRPYNNFLQQSTIYNSQGIPFFPAADLVATTSMAVYEKSTDQIKITLPVCNQGDVGITAPWYISTYKVKTPADSLIAVSTINLPVARDATENITYYLPVTD